MDIKNGKELRDDFFQDDALAVEKCVAASVGPIVEELKFILECYIKSRIIQEACIRSKDPCEFLRDLGYSGYQQLFGVIKAELMRKFTG